MDFKPGDFFIGIIDFFSVLLPGALVTFFINAQLHNRIFGEGMLIDYTPDSVSGPIIFLFSSYVLGHIIFSIASFSDGPVYDNFLRGYFSKGKYDLAYISANLLMEKYLPQKKLKQEILSAVKFKNRFEGPPGKSSVNHLEMYRRKQLKKLNKDLYRLRNHSGNPGEKIQELKNKITKWKGYGWDELRNMFIEDNNIEVINTFKSVCAILHLEKENILQSLMYKEANQKFFRSLYVAFLIIIIIIAIQWARGAITPSAALTAIIVGLILSAAAIWHYGNLRFKCTQFAYEIFILMGMKSNLAGNPNDYRE
jgi:hypothetical protein